MIARAAFTSDSCCRGSEVSVVGGAPALLHPPIAHVLRSPPPDCDHRGGSNASSRLTVVALGKGQDLQIVIVEEPVEVVEWFTLAHDSRCRPRPASQSRKLIATVVHCLALRNAPAGMGSRLARSRSSCQRVNASMWRRASGSLIWPSLVGSQFSNAAR